MESHVNNAKSFSQLSLEWNPIYNHLLWYSTKFEYYTPEVKKKHWKRSKSPKDSTDKNFGKRIKVKSDQSDQIVVNDRIVI